MDSPQDLRNTIPDWCRYAIYCRDTSDKYYEVRVDITDSAQWQLTIRYGRRPDLGAGAIKTSVHPTMAIACALADQQMRAKIAKGYSEIPRPDDANLNVRKDYREN